MDRWINLHTSFRETFLSDSRGLNRKDQGALLLKLEVQLIEAEHVCPETKMDLISGCIRILSEHVSLGLFPERELRVLARSARWCERQGIQDLAETLYVKLIAGAEVEKNVEMQVQATEELGDLYRKLGKFNDAVSFQKTAFHTAEKNGLYNLQAHALNNLAVIKIESGDFDGATDLFDKALALLEKIPEPLLEGHIYNNLGVIRCIKGEQENAEIEFNRALIYRSRSRDQRGFAETSHNLGMAAMDSGLLDHAEEYFDRALIVARNVHDKLIEANILLSRAELFLKRNNPVIAGAVSAEAQTIHKRFDDPLGIADGLRISGEAEMAQFRNLSAEKYLQKSLELNTKYQHLLGQAQCYDALCRLADQSDKSAETKQWAHKAISLWQQLENEDAATRLAQYL
ncbi:tetratricopeptide repeat protein [bacterium]|nr:tetratricopeptide repeat protein [bacterium]